jgi:hypothetical protein
MRLFSDGTGVDRTSVDAALERTASDCCHIITTHVDFVTPHEASYFQVQSEALAHSVCIYTDRGYQAFC